MPTKPLESVLYRELSRAEAAGTIELASGLLQELVNYASNALVRCATSSEAQPLQDYALLCLYRHIMEMVDAVEILTAQACAVPAMPLVRSAFEAVISMEYIVEAVGDYRARSLAWLVDYVHQRLASYELLDPSTARGSEFRHALAHDEVAGAVSLPLPAEVGVAILNLKELLAQPEVALVDERLRQLGKPRRWYRLSGGPSDLRELARHVGRGGQYDVLYRQWSRVVHAQDFSRFFVKIPVGQGELRGIRDTRELKQVASFAANYMLRATFILLTKFRPGENPRAWYEREVRQRYRQLSG